MIREPLCWFSFFVIMRIGDGMKETLTNYMNHLLQLTKRKEHFKMIGTTEETIQEIEDKMGIAFPRSLRDFYLTMNGEQSTFHGSFFGLMVYSIEEMYRVWEEWRVYDADEELNDSEYYASIVSNKVQCLYTNPLWIPLAHDGAGNYFGIDLDPDEEGVVGQIINFGRDENEKMVFADSLVEFIQLMDQYIEEEGIVIHEDHENYLMIGVDGQGHGIDVLRTLLLEKEEEEPVA